METNSFKVRCMLDKAHNYAVSRDDKELQRIIQRIVKETKKYG